MVYLSNNGFIKLNRGDSFSLALFINVGTPENPVRYSIQDNPNDTIYFGVMEPNQKFENAVIRQTYNSNSLINENGDVVITMEPKDTLCLIPGKYYYSIKLVNSNTNSVNTIVPMTEFYIMD